jgi:16S rRNA U1498 N3-methylase RsmE
MKPINWKEIVTEAAKKSQQKETPNIQPTFNLPNPFTQEITKEDLKMFADEINKIHVAGGAWIIEVE